MIFRGLTGSFDSVPPRLRPRSTALRMTSFFDAIAVQFSQFLLVRPVAANAPDACHGNWDQHFNLGNALEGNCKSADQPIAGLLTDLQQRGLLKDTLVVWSGEFGRTPHAQGGDGRDHNNKGFTLWMAGGGVKGGLSYGQTDDYGYEAVENKVQIHDLHATILALLGLNHEKLTFNYAGRDFRLTDIEGNVIKALMA